MEHENDPDLDDPYMPSQDDVLSIEEPPEGRTPETEQDRAGQSKLVGGETGPSRPLPRPGSLQWVHEKSFSHARIL